MVQLEILSGKMAGTAWLARHFPVRIGRSPDADLHLEDDGVWDQHLELGFDRAAGFILQVQPPAAATVNNEPVQRVRLRNGDAIVLGAARLRFWLRPARQTRLWSGEAVVWLTLAAVCAGQFLLLDWLGR